MTSVMNNLAKASIVSLLPAASRNADANSTGVDVSGYEGEAQVIADLGFISGTGTLDVKLQTSSKSDFSSDVDDVTGGAFTQVAGVSSFQTKQLNMNGLKRYLRVVHDVSATGSPVYAASVTLVANKKYAA